MIIQKMNGLLVVLLSAETSKHRSILFGNQAFQMIKDIMSNIHTSDDPDHL